MWLDHPQRLPHGIGRLDPADDVPPRVALTRAKALREPGWACEEICLLQGLLLCGICGRRLGVRYTGNGGIYPIYQCNWRHREALSRQACMNVPSKPLASPFLHVARQAFSDGGSWVDEKGNFARRRDHLVQQLQPFRPQLSAQCGRASNITARSVEARNKSHLHRVNGY
jgi:Recombinase zinc beta ribbon domain